MKDDSWKRFVRGKIKQQADAEEGEYHSICWACSCGYQHLVGNNCDVCGDVKPTKGRKTV